MGWLREPGRGRRYLRSAAAEAGQEGGAGGRAVVAWGGGERIALGGGERLGRAG